MSKHSFWFVATHSILWVFLQADTRIRTELNEELGSATARLEGETKQLSQETAEALSTVHGQVPPRPTAAVPMDNPCCSSKLTRVRP